MPDSVNQKLGAYKEWREAEKDRFDAEGVWLENYYKHNCGWPAYRTLYITYVITAIVVLAILIIIKTSEG